MQLHPSVKNSRVIRSLAMAAALSALAACNSSTGSDGGASDKLITISSPAAKSTWKVGDSLLVQWSVKDDAAYPALDVDAVDVLLSPDDGMNWGRLNSGSIPRPTAAQPSPKWGNYKWPIPDSLLLTDLVTKVPLKGRTTCRLRIEQYTPSDSVQVTVTGDFTIN